MSTLGQKQTSQGMSWMSALPLKADIRHRGWHVRFVPKADISSVWKVRRKDIVGRHRAMNALERELTHRLDRHRILNLREHPRINQDLPGLCFVAEPRGNIGYRADGGIIEASLETDGAERGKPVCNADAETNVVPPSPANRSSVPLYLMTISPIAA